jgi:NAD+ synthase (glutamine-hydrolysing)
MRHNFRVVKITIAQLNPTIGDIQGNLDKATSALQRSAKEEADLLAFPELFLTGYPPLDLLEKNWFINKVEAAVKQLRSVSKKYPEVGVVIGCPWRTGLSTGKGLYNVALVIRNGEIVGIQAKTLLPTYDVFNETRYFDPAPKSQPVRFKGEKLGITVCEDAWNIQELWPAKPLYTEDPVAQLVKKGATLLINISASPFSIGKEELRWKFISKHVKRSQKPFLYVNQVGGNDELVFDGRSLMVNARGRPLFVASAFKEHMGTIDLKSAKVLKYKAQDKIETVFQALVLGTRDYLHKCGFKKAVIGLSGGIDSALVAVIAAEALGNDNVLGISMPSPFSSAGSVDDSKALAGNLGIDFKVIPITEVYKTYLNEVRENFSGKPEDSTEENIQARIRGNILMAFSNKFGYLTLSTGNKSELSTGYCTLYGDMSGGLAVISDVPKTMVYELAKYVNRNKEIIPQVIIDKEPSAELRPNQRDQDTLPPYPILDQILQLYIEEGFSAEEIIAKKKFDSEVVLWVVKTVDRNEYKRRQAAPGLKVTGKAFGRGRNMPVAAKFCAFRSE